MASIVVLAACLAVIRGNYRARLYGDMAIVKVLSVADRTPEGMAAHARRMVSLENLRRASLDPRLASLRQPLRAGDPHEAIGSSTGPQVYGHVDSVVEGTLSVDSVAEGSAAEAISIALAVADAYIADQGASRVIPWTARTSTGSQFLPMPLSEPWELALAVALAVLVSAFVLVVPTAWVSKRRLAATVVVAPIAAVLILELFLSFHPGRQVDIVVGVIVSGAFGVGAVRRPWLFLALAFLVWECAPVMDHGFDAVTLSAGGCALAWIVGAPAGWVSRSMTQGRRLCANESITENGPINSKTEGAQVTGPEPQVGGMTYGGIFDRRGMSCQPSEAPSTQEDWA